MQQLLTLQTTSSTPHAIALDAGDGREIAAIASAAGIAKDHTWAVCNDAAQAEEAAKHIGHVIHAEATGCRLAEAGASLALCRPKLLDIVKATSCLMEGGTIIVKPADNNAPISVQFGVDKQSIIRHLTGSFTALYQIDSENSIVGTKRDCFSNAHVGFRLDPKRFHELAWKYVLTSSPGFARGFVKTRPTVKEVEAIVTAMANAVEQEADDDDIASPIMPLSPGHMGMVLSSGMLDGLITLANGETVVIRGIANKSKYKSSEEITESDGGVRTKKTIYSEKAVLKIRTINQAGVMVDYKGDEDAK